MPHHHVPKDVELCVYVHVHMYLEYHRCGLWVLERENGPARLIPTILHVHILSIHPHISDCRVFPFAHDGC